MKNSNIRIFMALLRRDFVVMRSTLPGELIDASIILVIQLITLGKLLPLLGMPPEFIAPLFVGSGLFYILLTRGFSIAMMISYKIPSEGPGVLSYYCILPVSPWLIFAKYIVFFVIETCVITLPTVWIGVAVLRSTVAMPASNWLLLTFTYMLTLIFWGAYFFGSAFLYDFEWFRDSFWARRLEPCMSFSSLYFPWYAMYGFSPLLGMMTLLNPMTVMVEGMRTALLGNAASLSLGFCIPATLVWILYSFWRLKRGVIKRLDPVL
jgi:hypothetical protein